MTDVPEVPPFDHDSEPDTELAVEPDADSASLSPRWLGYRPRTLLIIGAFVLVVVLAEAQWLYSPLGSGGSSSSSATVSTTDPGDGQSGDPAADGTGDVATTEPTGVIYTTRSRVTIRSDPTSTSTDLGHVAAGTKITVTCTATGEAVTGLHGLDRHWDHLTVGSVTGYVTHALVTVPSGATPVDQIPAC